MDSTMEITYDSNSTDIVDYSYPAYDEKELIVSNSQPTCKSQKNLSPKRFAKRRATSRVSRKSRHRRQQHSK